MLRAGPMKNRKSEPDLPPNLDPNHPNYDAILLKRARLKQHRRRRLENSGAAEAQHAGKAEKTAAKKKNKPRRKT
jgi:hypothetical protein